MCVVTATHVVFYDWQLQMQRGFADEGVTLRIKQNTLGLARIQKFVQRNAEKDTEKKSLLDKY